MKIKKKSNKFIVLNAIVQYFLKSAREKKFKKK